MDNLGLGNLFEEARRRRLFGVLALYIVGAWVVLQVAATLFPGWRISDEAIRFVWIGAILLFPAAMIFGWRYDVSAHGFSKTPAADSTGGALPLDRSDFWILSLLGLFTLTVGSAVINEVLGMREAARPAAGASQIPENSIAVLPFVNMSDDASNEYFSDGITEQLLNELARIPDLHVAARTSSFFYKDKTEKIQTMGEELGVRTLLEGSVRKVGDNVRITAQLINASDGFHLWSDTYDRQLDDIFAVQDEIAAAIVATLRLELLNEDQERLDRDMTNSIDAYDIYLQAMRFSRIDAEGSLEKSNAMLQQAIDLDPEFAHAYNALAYNYLLQTYSSSMSIDEAAQDAIVLLDKALSLRPDLEEAHATLGLLKTRLRRYDEANEHYKTALAINGNYFTGHINHGLSLVRQSRLKEASAAYLRAQALDPLNANLNFNLGALMMLMGEPDNGLQFMHRALELDPDLYLLQGAITHWLGVYGRLAESVRHGRKVLASNPEHSPNISALISAYIYLGLVDDAEDLLADASERMPKSDVVRSSKITLMLSTGDNEGFIDLAEEEFRSLDVNIGDELSVRNRERAFNYAWASLLKGEHQVAADYFYWIAGEEHGIAAKTYDEMGVLKMLALAYRHLDRVDEANALLDRCLQLVAGARERGWATPSLFVRLAEVYAIRGDVENAVAQLEIAFERGWRNLGTLEYGIYWQDLQDDPGINRIKVLIYNDLEAQKELLRPSNGAAREIIGGTGSR